MRSFFLKLMRAVVSNDTIWPVIRKMYMFMWKLQHQRNLIERERQNAQFKEAIDRIFKEPVVLNGIFKGLRYPKFRSRSSSLYAKFLGSYEKELEATFTKMFSNEYSEILNIGCAEGYYAVGLAIKFPKAKIYAYDLEAESRELTMEMAKLNGVGDRVIVENYCGPETLKNFKFTGKGLVLSDCEGFEKQLFTKDNVSNLKNCDIVIETHDWVDITISTGLEQLFEPSHHIEVLQSLGDNIKAKTYEYEQLKGLDLKTRFYILEEGRRFVDEWLILRPRG